MSLRYRLWLSFAPLLLLLTGLGAGTIYALDLVGDRIEGILRENYRSVEAMDGMNEAIERMDSAFQSDLAGSPGTKGQYERAWLVYREHLEVERGNITELGEAELVAELVALSDRYREQGDHFFDPTRSSKDRSADYYSAADGHGPLQVTLDLPHEKWTVF